MHLPHINWRVSAGVLVMLPLLFLSPREMIQGFWFAYPALATVFYWPLWLRDFKDRRMQRKYDIKFRDLTVDMVDS